jgi:hypothetical protein
VFRGRSFGQLKCTSNIRVWTDGKLQSILFSVADDTDYSVNDCVSNCTLQYCGCNKLWSLRLLVRSLHSTDCTTRIGGYMHKARTFGVVKGCNRRTLPPPVYDELRPASGSHFH